MSEYLLPPRSTRLARLADPFDVVVVGGGITGAGVALDLQLRGLRTLLIEQGDWAQATSSASSRLVHGGLRYLENREFGLVRESLRERGRLMENAAGLVWPVPFLFPLAAGSRVSPLLLGLGLTTYGLLSLPRPLSWPRMVGRSRAASLIPGLPASSLRGCGAYTDGGTDDARLTLAVVRTASRAGAVVVSRVEATSVSPGRRQTEVRVTDRLTGDSIAVLARRVVLAGGPFTDRLRETAGIAPEEGRAAMIRPTRGSHIRIPRARLPIQAAVVLLGVDGRVMFLLPGPIHTAIGTTDIEVDPADDLAAGAHATMAEVQYLIDSANALLPDLALSVSDVVSAWAGLRPLLADDSVDPSSRSREEKIARAGSIYTIAGGKLTGYRAMAERLGAQIVDDLKVGIVGLPSPSVRHRLVAALPLAAGVPSYLSTAAAIGDGLDERELHAARVRRYGVEVDGLPAFADVRAWLDKETAIEEVERAVAREDAIGPADFLLRRTDVGYGTVSEVAARFRAVVDIMARKTEVHPEAWARIVEESRRELHARQAWRDDDPEAMP